MHRLICCKKDYLKFKLELSFAGLEANYRRLIYTVDGNYDTLEKLFKETKTMNDLSKWNNLSYKILK